MKNCKPGDYILWNGAPALIVGEINQRAACIQILESDHCPHCSGDLGKSQITMIVNSLLFQQSAEPIPTMEVK